MLPQHGWRTEVRRYEFTGNVNYARLKKAGGRYKFNAKTTATAARSRFAGPAATESTAKTDSTAGRGGSLFFLG